MKRTQSRRKVFKPKMFIRQSDLDAAARIWNELAEFSASKTDEALEHALRAVGAQIGAVDAFWLASTHDGTSVAGPLFGWRPREVFQLHRDATRKEKLAETMRHIRIEDFDRGTIAFTKASGATRASLRFELTTPEEWRSSWLYNDVLRPIGISDRLIGARSVAPGLESNFGFDRAAGDRPFGERERDFLYVFLQGAATFQLDVTRMYASYGIPPLTPRERDVLKLLLTDMSECEISRELGLTESTTHWYVVQILRKCGVQGRIGLMALWLRYDRSDARANRHDEAAG